MCGFCNKWNSSLQSDETCVLVDNRSRTSTSMSIEFESTGKNLSSLTLLRILLWTCTRAFSSLDCSSSLRNPNSSSVQLGISDLFSCSEFSNLDNAGIKVNRLNLRHNWKAQAIEIVWNLLFPVSIGLFNCAFQLCFRLQIRLSDKNIENSLNIEIFADAVEFDLRVKMTYKVD